MAVERNGEMVMSAEEYGQLAHARDQALKNTAEKQREADAVLATSLATSNPNPDPGRIADEVWRQDLVERHRAGDQTPHNAGTLMLLVEKSRQSRASGAYGLSSGGYMSRGGLLGR